MDTVLRSASKEVVIGAGRPFCVIGERINPTGRKIFQDQLRRGDLSVFDCPVGTFDDFSWGRTGAWLDTYGFKVKYEGDITLDGLSFRLRPCPLNNPLEEAAGPGVYPYPLLQDVADVPVQFVRHPLLIGHREPGFFTVKYFTRDPSFERLFQDVLGS